jgi:hypothetical protein
VVAAEEEAPPKAKRNARSAKWAFRSADGFGAKGRIAFPLLLPRWSMFYISDAAILPAVCDIWLRPREAGALVTRQLPNRRPKLNDRGYRPNKLHQWFTEDIGDPMLAQHPHALMMFQRLAIANGYGWHHFVNMVDQVLPKRRTNLELNFPPPGPTRLRRLPSKCFSLGRRKFLCPSLTPS